VIIATLGTPSVETASHASRDSFSSMESAIWLQELNLPTWDASCGTGILKPAWPARKTLSSTKIKSACLSAISAKRAMPTVSALPVSKATTFLQDLV
jgi:hypothetical protein